MCSNIVTTSENDCRVAAKCVNSMLNTSDSWEVRDSLLLLNIVKPHVKVDQQDRKHCHIDILPPLGNPGTIQVTLTPAFKMQQYAILKDWVLRVTQISLGDTLIIYQTLLSCIIPVLVSWHKLFGSQMKELTQHSLWRKRRQASGSLHSLFWLSRSLSPCLSD